MRPPGFTSRSANTVNDDAWPAIWFAGVPFNNADVRLAMALRASESSTGNENTLAKASSLSRHRFRGG